VVLSTPTPAPPADAAAGPPAPPARASAAPPPSFTGRLVDGLARLRAVAHGEHVLTVHVEPAELGPVRVRARIAADGVRIELLGVTDASRDALRGVLGDLRRDLAATGLSADLRLAPDLRPDAGANPQAGDGRRGDQPTPGRSGPGLADPRPAPGGPERAEPARRPDPAHPGRLDLLA
jgi:hypothetical protein